MVYILIWDKRRLTAPTTYFIKTPFQNWKKTSAYILGAVFLHIDYKVPFDKLREELTIILGSTKMRDKKINVLKVMGAKTQSTEIRALMSAKD